MACCDRHAHPVLPLPACCTTGNASLDGKDSNLEVDSLIGSHSVRLQDAYLQRRTPSGFTPGGSGVNKKEDDVLELLLGLDNAIIACLLVKALELRPALWAMIVDCVSQNLKR